MYPQIFVINMVAKIAEYPFKEPTFFHSVFTLILDNFISDRHRYYLHHAQMRRARSAVPSDTLTKRQCTGNS